MFNNFVSESVVGSAMSSPDEARSDGEKECQVPGAAPRSERSRVGVSEEEGFKNNCKMMTTFMKNIKVSQHNLSHDMQLDLLEMKEEMEIFLRDQKLGAKSKVSNQHEIKVSDNRYQQAETNLRASGRNLGSSSRDFKGEKERRLKQRHQGREDNGYGKKNYKDANRYRSRERSSSESVESNTDSSSSSKDKDDKRSSRGRRVKKLRRRSQRRSRSRESSEQDYNGRGYDYRQAPKLEKFREETGKDLKKYLEKFESFCKRNIRGGKQFWINSLEEHLEGKLLETFRILTDQEDDYEIIKGNLLRWYKDNTEIRKKNQKRKFVNAKPKEGETLYFFSLRLENLFKKAYQNKEINRSKKLMSHFKSSLPRRVREALETQLLSCALKGEKADWALIQQCMKLRDLTEEGRSHHSISDSSDERSKVHKKKEVVINLGQGDSRYSRGGEVTRNDSRDWSSTRRNSGNAGGERGRCNRCDKDGHAAKDCRWSLGLCLMCGGNNHYVQDCPNKRDYRPNNNRTYRNRSQSSSRDRGYSGQGFRQDGNSYGGRGNRYGFNSGRGNFTGRGSYTGHQGDSYYGTQSRGRGQNHGAIRGGHHMSDGQVRSSYYQAQEPAYQASGYAGNQRYQGNTTYAQNQFTESQPNVRGSNMEAGATSSNLMWQNAAEFVPGRPIQAEYNLNANQVSQGPLVTNQPLN